MADESKWGDLGDRIRSEWNNVTDKTKDAWDDVVDRVTDAYEGAADWTDDEVNEARGYFKGRYDEMNRQNNDEDNSEMKGPDEGREAFDDDMDNDNEGMEAM
jgi:uncharacterized protein YjbJ (UPF0337 family)